MAHPRCTCDGYSPCEVCAPPAGTTDGYENEMHSNAGYAKTEGVPAFQSLLKDSY